MSQRYVIASYGELRDIPRLEDCAAMIGRLLETGAEKARAALVNAFSPGRRARLFIASDPASGEPVGFAFGSVSPSLESGGDYFWMNELHVAEDHRGRGVGRAVVERIFDWCRAEGIRAVYGVCAPDNPRAAAFYGRTGFTTEGITWLVKRIE